MERRCKIKKTLIMNSLISITIYLKLVSAIFNENFISHWKIALQKLWKMFFFSSSKKLFSFSRYSDLCISVFPSFPPVSHCFKGWSNINLKVYNINCPNKNLTTHFVWYLKKEKRYGIETLCIDRVSNKEHFYGKVMQKICTKS